MNEAEMIHPGKSEIPSLWYLTRTCWQKRLWNKSDKNLYFENAGNVKMSTKELQDEEREVLSSIYDGDECFKQIDPNTYQYKVNHFLLYNSILY